MVYIMQPATCIRTVIEEMSFTSTTERISLDSEEEHHEQLLRYIEENQVGYNGTLQGPFGSKRGIEVCSMITISFQSQS